VMPPDASRGTTRNGTGSQPRLRKSAAPICAGREASEAEMEDKTVTVDGGRLTVEGNALHYCAVSETKNSLST